jgi:hypothetical protein
MTDEDLILDCGCKYVKLGSQLFYEPCSETCHYYKFTIETAKELGKPTDIWD